MVNLTISLDDKSKKNLKNIQKRLGKSSMTATIKSCMEVFSKLLDHSDENEIVIVEKKNGKEGKKLHFIMTP